MTMIWMARQADSYSAPSPAQPSEIPYFIFAHSMLKEAPHEIMQLSGNAPHFSTIAVRPGMSQQATASCAMATTRAPWVHLDHQ